MTEATCAPLNSKAEKKAFYRMVLSLVLPIALQNLINTAVNSADVVMLNYVSQEALAAVSQATQISFILSSLYYGLSSGASVLIAQYWGKKDYRTIERIMGIVFRVSMTVSLAVGLAAICVPELLMKIYTGDPALISEGALYLRVVGFSYLFMGVSVMYLNMMRSMERVVISTATYLVSFVTNVVLNAVFIFAFDMGVLGVALATSIARLVELTICIVDAHRSKTVRFRIRYIFERHPELTKDFFRFALPATGNEITWGVGFSMYAVILGHLSSDAIAANSIVQVVRNLTSVVGFGLANGASVLVGKAIGEGSTEKAKLYAKRLFHVTLISALAAGILTMLLRPAILGFAGDLTQTARSYLNTMLWINVYYVGGQIVNTYLVCGAIRAGGDTKFGFYCDAIAL